MIYFTKEVNPVKMKMSLNLDSSLTELWLTHWGWVTHICVSKLTIIGSDNGLSPDRRQAIISTNAGILLIGTLGTNFNEILIEIDTFSFKKIHFKMLTGKWWPFCLGLNVLSSSVKQAAIGSRFTRARLCDISSKMYWFKSFVICFRISVAILDDQQNGQSKDDVVNWFSEYIWYQPCTEVLNFQVLKDFTRYRLPFIMVLSCRKYYTKSPMTREIGKK